MYDSTNIIQTTLPGNTTFSSLIDSSAPDNVIKAYTGAPGVSLPTDSPSGATGTNGFTLLQLGTTQFYQEQGAVWVRSVAGPQPWFKLLPPINPNAASGYPYGLTNLPLEYMALTADESMSFSVIPGIYIGDATECFNLGAEIPTGATGHGFAMEVKTFPIVYSGATRQGYIQTYTDTAGEWKRVATTPGGNFGAWVRTVTF